MLDLAAAGAAVDVAWPWALPFALLLLSIAILPLVAPHFWHSNRNRGLVAALAAIPVAIWALVADPTGLAHAGLEYAAFVALIGSLYVVSGGVYLDGDLRATPWVNAGFLAVGAVLANLIGTTGAAMLLVRPLLHTNIERKHVRHTLVFFIFTVCNAGGCLTPIGDPPLFLGYLAGVPFEWTLGLWPAWLAVNALLIGIYLVFDFWAVRRETPQALRRDRTEFAPLRFRGLQNVPLLLGIVALVALGVQTPWREIGMVVLALLSLKLTPTWIREKNRFTWHPIVEVMILFAGIFVTMVPALNLLKMHGGELGLMRPIEFFWGTGILSAFLDNAPTYLVFLNIAQSSGLTPAETVGIPDAILAAISLGAVFLGAATYIGNGPNFMVKAIADERGIKMPSFFGYAGWAVVFLLPVVALVTWLFLG